MDAAPAPPRKSVAWPLDLTDLVLETAVRACRALAHIEPESAEKINPKENRGIFFANSACSAVNDLDS